MTKYKKFNLIGGWTVFAIAAFTFISTMEPTASLWDCGEFIATSFKLEVGHPPGAPFFMIIQRVVSDLAGGDVTKVAWFMNLISALASAFTILFLFWSISYIAKKIILKTSKKAELTDGQLIAVLGSAAVGALAYTFSDSFWFSAVEAEVYAMSSLFTALVFWSILKWDEQADQPHADRWLILIAYLMGLSIGVHLLNLLVIPSIALIYYFRRYKATIWGGIFVFLLSVVILAFVMYGIIQGLVSIGSGFELFFVNTLKLPFDLGFFTFLVLLIAAIIWLIAWSKKKGKRALHLATLALLMIIIGYSSYATLVIRSTANPPIDENDPENTFALKAYLDREQYGERPLLYGQYYDADAISQTTEYTYIRGNKKYIKVKKTNPKYEYDPSRCTFFPRMYSSQKDHISAYKSWGGVKNNKPTFANNIKFFMSYQVGFMYLRYFMWNFVGKENDIQGHGGPLHGNWLSGIKFIDNAFIAPQKDIPDKWKNRASRNKLYFLPLILGIIGLIYQFDKDKHNFWVVLTLFIMTGLAIVVYLNQTPYQPRERDYAYVGSFYAFTIWMGLSVLAAFDFLKKIKNEKLRAIAPTVLLLLVPVLMGSQEWNDHTRAHRYHVRDLASDYLNSCDKDAILFTFGDNDTFPLWFDQEVLGIRTDVRDVNLSLFSTDWYTNQMRRKAYTSDPIPINIPKSKYQTGTREVVFVKNNPNVLFMDKYKANKKEFAPMYDSLFTQMLAVLKKSNFPQNYPSDYIKLQKGYKSLTAEDFVAFINTINSKSSQLGINSKAIALLKNATMSFASKVANSYAPIRAVMNFVLSDDPSTKLSYGNNGEMANYIPTDKILIPVNKEQIKKMGFVAPDKMHLVGDNIKFIIKKKYLFKANWLLLEMLAENNWKRPIYFATSIGRDNYMGLSDYFRLEGFAFRLMPYKTANKNSQEIGEVNSKILYNNVMNKFKWGNIADPRFNVDHYVERTVGVMDVRNVFHRLAAQLMLENKKDSAKVVLDKCLKVLPDNKIAYDYTILPVIEDYYKLGDFDQGNKIARQLIQNYGQQIKYFNNFTGKQAQLINRDQQIALYVLQNMYSIAFNYKQTSISKLIEPILQANINKMKYLNK